MNNKSTQIALGGVASSLCLLLMFFTGLIPFSTFAMPALAGMVLIAIVIENGYKAAFMVFFSVAFLSIFIVPDREAALIFIAFTGYYPIIKGAIERIPFFLFRYIIKFLTFNTAIISLYLFLMNVLGINEVLNSMGEFGKYTPLILLVMGNVIFIIYDFALTNIVYVYLNVIRPKITGKKSI